MSEEKLNEMVIQSRLKGVCQDCMHFKEITKRVRAMISEVYTNGFKQGKFDTTVEFAYQINEALDALKVLKLHIQDLRPSNLKVIEDRIKIIENILKGSESNE